jgi:hypothetical protein
MLWIYILDKVVFQKKIKKEHYTIFNENNNIYHLEIHGY